MRNWCFPESNVGKGKRISIRCQIATPFYHPLCSDPSMNPLPLPALISLCLHPSTSGPFVSHSPFPFSSKVKFALLPVFSFFIPFPDFAPYPILCNFLFESIERTPIPLVHSLFLSPSLSLSLSLSPSPSKLLR